MEQLDKKEPAKERNTYAHAHTSSRGWTTFFLKKISSLAPHSISATLSSRALSHWMVMPSPGLHEEPLAVLPARLPCFSHSPPAPQARELNSFIAEELKPLYEEALCRAFRRVSASEMHYAMISHTFHHLPAWWDDIPKVFLTPGSGVLTQVEANETDLRW